MQAISVYFFFHLFFYGHFSLNFIIEPLACRDVAQPGRALRSGRRSRAFKSRHPDHFLLYASYAGATPAFAISCP